MLINNKSNYIKKNEKMSESAARRELKKLGFKLVKSRKRNLTVDNCGGYSIIDSTFNSIAAGERFELTLDDVIKFIMED